MKMCNRAALGKADPKHKPVLLEDVKPLTAQFESKFPTTYWRKTPSDVLHIAHLLLAED